MLLEYFKIGINHILDLEGLDHFYFIISFCLLYELSEWKTIIKLITAFTLGHSSTLILASLNMISFNLNLIETLITVTIIITCLKNYYDLIKNKTKDVSTGINYVIISLFGLTHGMGFSSFIKNMLFDGENFLTTLIGFNLGVEAAQIIIVILFLTVMTALYKTVKQIKTLKLIINTIILSLTLLLLF